MMKVSYIRLLKSIFIDAEIITLAGRDYLVATTQMINGNSFLEPIVSNVGAQERN